MTLHHHYYTWGPRLIPRLMGSASGATSLLGAEADGLSIDFTDASIDIRDTTTTSNAWNGASGTVQDFWRSRSFTSYASPSPKITRDSDGTYTYRPHNLVAMSQEFRSAYFTATRCSITTSAVTAPDGSSTMFKLVEDGSNNSHNFERNNVTISSAINYTTSVYAKAAERTWILLGDNTIANVGAWFNLGTGAVGTRQGNNLTATIEDIGGGVYRCKVTWLSTGTGSRPAVYLASADNTSSYQGDSASGAYIWGLQLNAGQSALTYVPTRAHNLNLQSQTLDNASWTATSLTVTANSVAAPDGTTTADTLALVDASATHNLTATGNISYTIGLTYTASWYLKANTHSYAQVVLPSGAFGAEVYANFNLSTGVVGTTGSSTTATITAVGGGWYRCSVSGPATSTASATLGFFLVSGASAVRGETWDPNSTNSIYAWGAQVELASSPGKYTATTTAAVYSANYDLPREWDSSGVCQGLLVEEARTNICLYARDLTQGSGSSGIGGRSGWNSANLSYTAALTATGIDGGANRASTLTSTAANGAIIQHMTSASAARSLSMFVKRRTGTGTVTISHGATTGSTVISNGDFSSDTVWTKGSGWTIAAGVATRDATAGGTNLTQSGVVTAGKFYRIVWTQSAHSVSVYVGSLSAPVVLTTSTGGTYNVVTQAVGGSDVIFRASATVDSIDNVSVTEVAETDITSSINSSTWTRVSIPNETITNPAVCIKLATSGDAIDIDYVQSEAGAFITSPIYTSSASVTRAVDLPSFSLLVMPYAQATVTKYWSVLATYPQTTSGSINRNYFCLTDNNASTDHMSTLVSSGASAVRWQIRNDTALSVDTTGSVTLNSGSVNKMAYSATTNDFASYVNGTVDVTDTSVTMPDTVYWCHIHAATTGTSAGGSAYIRQAMILPRAMSDAELDAVTT